MVSLSLSRFFLFSQAASFYAPNSDKLVGNKISSGTSYRYGGPTHLPDLLNNPDQGCLQFLIENMLVSGPLGMRHREQVKRFLDKNANDLWIRNLTRCVASSPDGGCSKLLVALLPVLLESFPKTLKDNLLELDLVELLVRAQVALGNWYGLAELINGLPLEILYQSRTVTLGLDKYIISRLGPLLDNPESLCASKRIEVLLAGGDERTVFIPSSLFIQAFEYLFDIFKQTWPANQSLMTPGFHIPLCLYVSLLQDRPENFFADLSRDSMFALIDFLCYTGMKRGTKAVLKIQSDMRGAYDDGATEIREGKWIHCDEVAKLRALATQDVFLELTPTLTLKDLQDILKVGGNDILAYFLPSIEDELLIQLSLDDPASLFKNRIQAKKQLYVPGMIPFKFLKPSFTSPEILKKYSKEIVAALTANQTGVVVVEGTRKRIVSALACMDDLSLEERVLLQWS